MRGQYLFSSVFEKYLIISIYKLNSYVFSDSGLIDCSEGYYIMRNDGTLGTLVFNENGVMQFVVWL